MIKFNIYRREMNNDNEITIASNLTNNYFNDTNALANKEYIYRIESFEDEDPDLSANTLTYVDSSPHNKIFGGETAELTFNNRLYKIHIFKESDYLDIVSINRPIDILIVGGGGGGGIFGGGGGGGGGVGATYNYQTIVGQYRINVGAGASDLTSNGQGRSGGESNILNEANTKLIYATGGAGGNYGSGGNSGGNSGEVFFNGTSISTKYNGGPGGSSGIYNGGAGAGAAPVNGNGGGAGKNIVGFGFDDIYFGGGGGAGPNSTNNIVIAGGYNTGGIGRNAEGGTPSTKGMTNGGGGGGGSWGGYNGTNGGGSGLVVIRYRL